MNAELLISAAALLVTVLIVLTGREPIHERANENIKALIEAIEQVRSASRERRTKAIEAPNNNHPPQFAEYLLYFLPKTLRKPLLGDLEEEYREVYARFGKRKATVWYYAQVGLSYWPLLCRAARKLVKWGVLGWIGGAVRRLIS